MSYLAKAIRKLKPTAEFSFTDEDYLNIQWDVLEGDAPTQADIDTAIQQVIADEAQSEINKVADKAALLNRLGITAEEAKLLLLG